LDEGGSTASNQKAGESYPLTWFAQPASCIRSACKSDWGHEGSSRFPVSSWGKSRSENNDKQCRCKIYFILSARLRDHNCPVCPLELWCFNPSYASSIFPSQLWLSF
jgi:hypothetical protein